jgi:hypothetical protein
VVTHRPSRSGLLAESRGGIRGSEAKPQNDGRKCDDPAIDLRHDDLSLVARRLLTRPDAHFNYLTLAAQRYERISKQRNRVSTVTRHECKQRAIAFAPSYMDRAGLDPAVDYLDRCAKPD